MALTKHQILARWIKTLLNALDVHTEKTIAASSRPQFGFYESYSTLGRPPIKEEALRAMTNTHRCGLQFFSSNEKLKAALQSSTPIGIFLPIKVYPRSLSRWTPPDASSEKRWVTLIPWKVDIVLPAKIIEDLHERIIEALLYCPPVSAISEWIDSRGNEDKAATFTNQFYTFEFYSHERKIFRKNLNQPVFEIFRKAALEYYKETQFSKVFNTIEKTEFAPNAQSTIDQAYELISRSLRCQKRRDFDDFQRFWRIRLEEQIFATLNWPEEKKQAILKERFTPRKTTQKKNSKPRQTGLCVDKKTYSSFIQFFAKQFLKTSLLKNSQKNKVYGEIVLLLWIMICISQDPDHIFPIERLLKLTTADVEDQIIRIDSHEIDIFPGLADLLKEYTGGIKLERQQKLFPNLNPNKLADYFRRASLELLPEGSIAALPKAFLTFPHPEENIRMPSESRRKQQKHPAHVHYNLLSRHEIKRRFIKTSKS